MPSAAIARHHMPSPSRDVYRGEAQGVAPLSQGGRREKIVSSVASHKKNKKTESNLLTII